MAGFGRDHREAHRLLVAKLADDDDVRILSERTTHGGGEAPRVSPHLALVHERLLRRVHELDRVLEREHVRAPRLVQHVHERRERVRLSGAGGTCEQDDALVVRPNLLEILREAERGKRRRDVRDDADDRARAANLTEHVHAVAADARDRVAEVDGAFRVEDGASHRVQDLVDERLDLPRGERLHLHALDDPVDTQERRLVRRDVEVRCLRLARERKEALHRAGELRARDGRVGPSGDAATLAKELNGANPEIE